MAEREAKIAGEGSFRDSQIALHNVEKIRDSGAGVTVWGEKIFPRGSNFLRQESERNKGGVQSVDIHSVIFDELCNGSVTVL